MITTHENITQEECLVSVYRQSKICGFARLNFISAKLNTDFATTQNILNNLSEMGLIKTESYGMVFLTDHGKNHAEALQNKS